MDKDLKQKLKKMISGYCDLKGIDKESFVNECRAKFGKDDASFATGVLEVIKSDTKTLKLVDRILEADSFKTMEILPANEVNNNLSVHLAFDEGDELLVEKTTKEILGETK